MMQQINMPWLEIQILEHHIDISCKLSLEIYFSAELLFWFLLASFGNYILSEALRVFLKFGSKGPIVWDWAMVRFPIELIQHKAQLIVNLNLSVNSKAHFLPSPRISGHITKFWRQRISKTKTTKCFTEM